MFALCVWHIFMLLSNVNIQGVSNHCTAILRRNTSAERLDCHMNPDERSLVGGFNPISKNISPNWIISPSRDEHKKYLSCHHVNGQFFACQVGLMKWDGNMSRTSRTSREKKARNRHHGTVCKNTCLCRNTSAKHFHCHVRIFLKKSKCLKTSTSSYHDFGTYSIDKWAFHYLPP